MPMRSRRRVISSTSTNLRSSPWTLKIATRCLHARLGYSEALAADDLEQELEDLQVPLRLAEVDPPRVEPVPAQEEPVRARMLRERGVGRAGDLRDVL